LVLKESLRTRTRTRINITDRYYCPRHPFLGVDLSTLPRDWHHAWYQYYISNSRNQC